MSASNAIHRPGSVCAAIYESLWYFKYMCRHDQCKSSLVDERRTGTTYVALMKGIYVHDPLARGIRIHDPLTGSNKMRDLKTKGNKMLYLSEKVIRCMALSQVVHNKMHVPLTR